MRESHTFMAKKSYFLLRGNTILKIQFELAPSNREIELLIAFFGLPNAIDNPLPLIVIKANFFISKGTFMHS